MNIKAYIESGILELYALDLLQEKEKAEVEKAILVYPEAKAEVDSIQRAIEGFAALSAITPPSHMKQKIVETISNFEKECKMDLDDLPLLNKFSDYRSWLALVKDYIPERLEDGIFSRVLRDADNLMQTLVVSSTDFEDEIHVDVYESFLMLEGKCKCTVGGQVYFMEAGEYTEIPLHEIHRVEILTPRVVAILQHSAVN